MPIINPPAKKHVLEPEYVNNLFRIENILRRNSSDWEKLDELINQVNKTGNLAKVNVLNATSRIDNDIDLLESSASASEQKFTYMQPHETNLNHLKISYEAPKDNIADAKDLKVQFVLDCDTKDGTSLSQTPFNLPNGIRPSVQYPPAMEQSVFNIQRVSTTRPSLIKYTQPNQVYHVPTKAPQKYSNTIRSTTSHYYPTRKKVPPKRATSQPNTNPTKAPLKPSNQIHYPTKAPSPVRSSAPANAVYYYPTDDPPNFSSNAQSNAQLNAQSNAQLNTLSNAQLNTLSNAQSNAQAVYYFPTEFPIRPTTVKANITKTIKTSTKKPSVKNVYVDPPMVAAISDTFENVYTYFEDALTTKVRVTDKKNDRQPPKSFMRKRGKKRPIMKRSTVVHSRPVTEMSSPIVYASTEANRQRYTQSYATQNGQKLTTNIQVTSEYVGKEPATDRPIKDESDSGSEIGGDYYSDDYSSDSDIRDEEDEDDDYESESESSDYGISLGIGVSASKQMISARKND